MHIHCTMPAAAWQARCSLPFILSSTKEISLVLSAPRPMLAITKHTCGTYSTMHMPLWGQGGSSTFPGAPGTTIGKPPLLKHYSAQGKSHGLQRAPNRLSSVGGRCSRTLGDVEEARE